MTPTHRRDRVRVWVRKVTLVTLQFEEVQYYIPDVGCSLTSRLLAVCTDEKLEQMFANFFDFKAEMGNDFIDVRVARTQVDYSDTSGQTRRQMYRHG